MQDLDSPLEPRHELVTVSSPGTKSLCLILKDSDHGLNGFAICEPVDDLMAEQVGPCSLLEFVQGSFEEWFQLWRGIDRHGINEGRWFVCEVIAAVILVYIERLTFFFLDLENDLFSGSLRNCLKNMRWVAGVVIQPYPACCSQTRGRGAQMQGKIHLRTPLVLGLRSFVLQIGACRGLLPTKTSRLLIQLW